MLITSKMLADEGWLSLFNNTWSSVSSEWRHAYLNIFNFPSLSLSLRLSFTPKKSTSLSVLMFNPPF